MDRFKRIIEYMDMYKRDFAYYDSEFVDWVVDSGNFNILVGSVSNDISLGCPAETDR